MPYCCEFGEVDPRFARTCMAVMPVSKMATLTNWAARKPPSTITPSPRKPSMIKRAAAVSDSQIKKSRPESETRD